MAVVMVMRGQGVTPEDYEQAREIVGWEGNPAPGGIHHMAWFDDEGIHVIDIWETERDFQRFADERLMPGLASAGLLEGKPEPEVSFAPLHARFDPDKVTASA